MSNRDRRGTSRLLAGAAAALCLSPQCAWADVYSRSDSFVNVEFNPATTINQTQVAYVTRIVGTLNGIALTDETFAQPITDTTTQAGLSAARLAMSNAAGPSFSSIAPTLVAESSDTTTSISRIYSLNHYDVVTAVVVIPPGGQTSVSGVPGGIGFWTDDVGHITRGFPTCAAAIATLPGSNRPFCDSGAEVERFALGLTQTRTTTIYYVDTTITNTTTSTLSQTYEMDATIANIASIHTAVSSGFYELARGFQQRALAYAAGGDEAGIRPAEGGMVSFDGFSLWAAVSDQWSRDNPRAGAEGNRRNGRGLAAGFDYNPRPGVVFGFSVEQEREEIAQSQTAQSASLDLTQLGASAAFARGEFLAALCATYGMGDGDVSHGSSTLASSSSPHYSVWGAAAQTGYRFAAHDFELVPEAVFNWGSVHRGPVTETGGVALLLPALTAEYAEVALGLRTYGDVQSGDTDWTFSAYLHGTDLMARPSPDITGTLAIYPTVAVLNHGVDEQRYGISFGASVSVAFAGGMRIFAGFDGRQSGGFRSQAVNLGFRLAL